jgi:hypothetical protein
VIHRRGHKDFWKVTYCLLEICSGEHVTKLVKYSFLLNEQQAIIRDGFELGEAMVGKKY